MRSQSRLQALKVCFDWFLFHFASPKWRGLCHWAHPKKLESRSSERIIQTLCRIYGLSSALFQCIQQHFWQSILPIHPRSLLLSSISWNLLRPHFQLLLIVCCWLLFVLPPDMWSPKSWFGAIGRRSRLQLNISHHWRSGSTGRVDRYAKPKI